SPVVERLGGKGCQSIQVRPGLPVRVQGLDADMTCSGLEMFLDALLDRRLPPPGNHGVEKTVAATVRQVILAEAEAQPVVTVIGQGQVKCQRLTSYLAGLGGVLDEQYFLLDAEPLVRAEKRPRPCRM